MSAPEYPWKPEETGRTQAGASGASAPGGEAKKGEAAAFGRTEAADVKRYLRLAAYGVVAVLAAVLLFSNLESVPVSLVFTTVEMPLILALLLAMVLGALLGAGYMYAQDRKKAKAAKAAAKRK